MAVFLWFAFSSIPNVLSANNPNAESAGGLARAQDHHSSASSGQGVVDLDHHIVRNPMEASSSSSNHILDSADPILNLNRNAKRESNIVTNRQGNVAGQEIQDETDHTFPSQHTRSVRHFSSSVKPSPTLQSEGQQEQTLRSSLMEEIELWSLFKTSTSLLLRISLWCLQKLYHSMQFVVAKPVSVAAALVETPYLMTRDICKAFLPVYSFFTVAAMIGIVVGGCALWIAQLLISAIGADHDKQVAVVVHGSVAPRYQRSPGQRQVFAVPAEVAYFEAQRVPNGASHIKHTASNRKPGIDIPQDVPTNKGRGTIQDEDIDDDDDDDDDEEEDWDHV
ncbi:hypothetical protein BGZ65_006016 [Modicella reniformis]|uniref:Uncharacterized protein n=1 Tax=Modicella reniformis TaxID=1440133 RepID=A0A9P6IMT0_9FUNG|nr:hypothetical protein BGZ65_006016 [Modicella reniformis]